VTVEIRKIEATNEAGETVQAYVIPDGYVACLVSAQDAERLREWQECAAVRIGPASEDGRVSAFEIAPDLEWLTSEEGPQ
jgi:hypothetical protein